MSTVSPYVAAIGTALPANYVAQERLTAALREVWAQKHSSTERFDRIQSALGVAGRYLALSFEEYPLPSFAAANDAWLRVAPELAEAAARDALAAAELQPADVDHVFFVTVTGIGTPTADVGLATRLGMRRDVKRTPIFGLGCVAGASGIARAVDYVRAYEREVAMVVSVELCSLTLQLDDLSAANIIASGLFGDGAAVALVAGGARGPIQSPRIVATRSILYPDTERIMGWDLVAGGFKIVLSARLPELICANLGADVDSFLAAHNLTRGDIAHWVAHPGGPKILRAVEDSLELPPESLARSWRFLESTGNLSSASILFIMRDFLREHRAQAGDWGLMLAMGPGFCVELVLLQW
ncbi:MAG TPA: 3-oxoacyl-[acyl-carrier-protein] synthase III C-terminal domain-containing protein [Candidatus Binataceae bacterium]|nr:3-oxoacyl-[acyl-carrier-protein] synthase III C-terminal domain-containing protein [Candidatus Binataceae bacterium]